MMLTEVAAVGPEALPLAAFKTHLRLGSGFADDGATDAAVEAALRAAIAAIEARTSKALLARSFALTLSGWRDPEDQPLPLAPVRAILRVTTTDRLGARSEVLPGSYRLVRDAHRPQLAAAGSLLPAVPSQGSVEVVFEAGFGGWTDVPADLAQAVFLLATQYYEERSEAKGGGPMSFGVVALIERWRSVRVLGGGRR